MEKFEIILELIKKNKLELFIKEYTILKESANIEIDEKVDENERTFLLRALQENSHTIAHYILDLGANPNCQDKYGNSALCYVPDDIALTRKLITLGANVNHNNMAGMNPIIFAMMNKKFTVIEILLSFNTQKLDINWLSYKNGEQLKSLYEKSLLDNLVPNNIQENPYKKNKL